MSEMQALTRLAFQELGDGVAGIGRIHKAVADRAFGAPGPGARPARVVHDQVARVVYGGLRRGSHAAGRSLALVAPERTLSETPGGAALLAALNGLVGDELEREDSPLAAPMSFRVNGRAVDPADLAAALGDVTGALAVFVHGLMETEHSWNFGGAEPYGARLRRELGYTPVDLRYNSGRRISQNGRSLDELLEELVAAWPVKVTGIALIGHSMGGLVARSACHCASERDAAWVRHVSHVVALGTPHTGAPLEQLVHYASAALHRVPESRPLGAFLRRRSGGIRDLRQGSLVDQDWEGRDPDALRAEACQEVPLLEGVAHHFVSATLTRSEKHPLGRLVGDILVLTPSASGRSRTRRIGFRDEDGVHVGAASHFALLNHPQVYSQLETWLAPGPRR